MDQMRVELASLLTAGMNTYLAVAAGHDGSLDEGTMRLVDYSGEWLRARRPRLQEAQDAPDVAVLLGTANPKELQWPGGAPGYDDELAQIEANLRANGYLPHRLINCAGSRKYDGIPPTVRTVIVPDRAQLTPSDAEMLDAFVRRGDKALAIGRGMGLAGTEEPTRAASMFGIHNAGYVSPGRVDSFVVRWNNDNLSMPGPILAVSATSAEPLLWASVRAAGEMPVFTRNRVGNGTAYALPATESALAEKPDFLCYLWRKPSENPRGRLKSTPSGTLCGYAGRSSGTSST